MKQTKSVLGRAFAGFIVLVALGVFSTRFFYKPDDASAHSALGTMVLDASTTKDMASISANENAAEQINTSGRSEQDTKVDEEDSIRGNDGKDSDAGELQTEGDGQDQNEIDNQENNADVNDNGSDAASIQGDSNDEHDGDREINTTSSEENASQNNLLDVRAGADIESD